MEESLVREIPLANNLRLDVYNGSRRLAGDRWLVRLIARIRIPVDTVWDPESAGDVSKSAVKEKIGDTAVFETVKTRHFIDEQKTGEAFASMQDQLVRHSAAYLGHPAFPMRFILKLYRESRTPHHP
jgi:hypothetical protein